MKTFSRGGGFGGGSFAKRGGFNDRGGDRRDDRGGDRGGDRGQMFDATCSSCGSDCQVPFRPNGRKPVLCTSCFRREGGGSGDDFRPSPRNDRGMRSNAPASNYSAGPSFKASDERLQSIEAKLDVILSQLRRIAREEKPAPKEIEDESGE